MTSLQGPGRQNSPDAFADLVARLTTMRREMSDMTSSLLRSAGIRVSPEGMSIESALEILGSLDVSGDLNVTGSATFSGDTTIGGNAAITGTLSLPAGVIDNDALANPITMRDVFASEASFAFSGAAEDRAVFTYTVPTGFTRFTFTGAASVRAYNATASTIYLYAQAYTQVVGGDTFWGPSQQAAIPAGFTASIAAPHSSTIDIPPGATQVRVWARVQTSSAVASAAQNFATVEGVGIFTR